MNQKRTKSTNSEKIVIDSIIAPIPEAAKSLVALLLGSTARKLPRKRGLGKFALKTRIFNLPSKSASKVPEKDLNKSPKSLINLPLKQRASICL